MLKTGHQEFTITWSPQWIVEPDETSNKCISSNAQDTASPFFLKKIKSKYLTIFLRIPKIHLLMNICVNFKHPVGIRVNVDNQYPLLV